MIGVGYRFSYQPHSGQVKNGVQGLPCDGFLLAFCANKNPPATAKVGAVREPPLHALRILSRVKVVTTLWAKRA